jgi:hypothetical protein
LAEVAGHRCCDNAGDEALEVVLAIAAFEFDAPAVVVGVAEPCKARDAVAPGGM